jgi:hypothetical protein
MSFSLRLANSEVVAALEEAHLKHDVVLQPAVGPHYNADDLLHQFTVRPISASWFRHAPVRNAPMPLGESNLHQPVKGLGSAAGAVPTSEFSGVYHGSATSARRRGTGSNPLAPIINTATA